MATNSPRAADFRADLERVRAEMGPAALRPEFIRPAGIAMHAIACLESREIDLAGLSTPERRAHMRRIGVLIPMAPNAAPLFLTADFLTECSDDADVCAEHVDLGAVWLCNRDIRTVLSDEALRLVRVQVANAIADQLDRDAAAAEQDALEARDLRAMRSGWAAAA